jgi:hypothetical protein
MSNVVLTFRGDRDLWIKFVNELRMEKKQVWPVLEKFIRSYMKGKSG